MTEQSAEQADPRAWVQFHDEEEPAPVSLPGYLNAVPSIVKDGDTFSIAREYLDEITADGESERFVEVEAPDDESPNAVLSDEDLLAKVGEDEVRRVVSHPEGTPDDLVTLADDYDRMHPQPVGDGSPVPALEEVAPEPAPAPRPTPPPVPPVQTPAATNPPPSGDGTTPEGSNR